MATNPHIYVSSVHGTNTGGSDTSYATQQTGAMTSLTAGNVYNNIGSAIAGAAPSSGDTVYIADNHNAAYDNGSSPLLPPGVKFVSVSASNIDAYSPGAKENLTDFGDDYNIATGGIVLLAGLDLETGDEIIRSTNSECGSYCQDMIFRPDDITDLAIGLGQDGQIHKLVNCDIIANDSGAYCFDIGYGGVIIWLGGSVITATTLAKVSGQGGGTLNIVGVDLSPITTVYDSGPNSDDDNLLFVLQGCKLNSNLSLPTSFGKVGQRFEMYNCDDSINNKFYRFYIADYSGSAKNNDSTYVTTTESWYDGSDKSSIEVITTANCSHITPFIFELPAQYVDLSDTASDLITIDLVTDSTAVSLTDTDIAAFLVYPDGTTAVQANWVTSGKTVGTGNYGIDPLAAGTTLSASSLGAGDWTGEPASANFYKMELDTSGDAGQATAVTIRIEVYKASIGSGDLFIHPIITVS